MARATTRRGATQSSLGPDGPRTWAGHNGDTGDQTRGDERPREADRLQQIEWVSVPELARRVGVAKESVYRLARAGQLRGAVKMGRRYVVNYSAFVEASKALILDAAMRS